MCLIELAVKLLFWVATLVSKIIVIFMTWLVTLNRNKSKLSSPELSQKNSKLMRLIGSNKQLQDGASPTPLSVISSNAELTVETNHPSIEISCASSIELPLPTTLSFMPSEHTSENSAALSPNQTCRGV